MSNNFAENKSVEVCLIKHATSIPCPSCGSTRSVISVANGDFFDALNINPMGFVVAFILFLAPLWIIVDVTTRNKTLFDFYQRIEAFLKRPKYAILLIMLVIINWIWNITKGL